MTLGQSLHFYAKAGAKWEPRGKAILPLSPSLSLFLSGNIVKKDHFPEVFARCVGACLRGEAKGTTVLGDLEAFRCLKDNMEHIFYIT